MRKRKKKENKKSRTASSLLGGSSGNLMEKNTANLVLPNKTWFRV